MVGDGSKVTRREPAIVLVEQKNKHGVRCTVVVTVELWGNAPPPYKDNTGSAKPAVGNPYTIARTIVRTNGHLGIDLMAISLQHFTPLLGDNSHHDYIIGNLHAVWQNPAGAQVYSAFLHTGESGRNPLSANMGKYATDGGLHSEILRYTATALSGC